MFETSVQAKSNKILEEDLQSVFGSLTNPEKMRLKNSVILITGCAGFLGYYFLEFFSKFAAVLGIKKVIGLDNFKTGKPRKGMLSGPVKLDTFDIITADISHVSEASQADFVIHMASIASPHFYRRYPIETLDANVWGLRRLLEYYKNRSLRKLLFFSSSEVYGDPSEDFVPTPEDYRGNVASMGPRACYDEAKRFGETLCYLFHQQYGLPIALVRPFNNYGPGMKLDDRRAPADFARAITENKDIVMYSDGKPTRSFCYVADALSGYLKALLCDKPFECFNIGLDDGEVSIADLAKIFVEAGRKVFGYTGQVRFEQPAEKDYLTHNPNRRCPDISRARSLLGYQPSIKAQEGVCRFLEFLKIQGGDQ